MIKYATDYGLKDMYKVFKEKYPNVKLTISQFNKFVKAFNQEARELVLRGGTLNMNSWQLGKIEVCQFTSSLKTSYRSRINWPESKKQRAAGVEKWLVFYTDEDYYHIKWMRSNWLLNSKCYKFTPTRGPRGIKAELSQIIRTDPITPLKYKPSKSWSTKQ